MGARTATAGADRRYAWGRLFVRFATIGGMVLTALGIIIALFQIILLRRGLETYGRRSSAEFSGDIATLQAGCRQAAEAVAAGFGPAAVPAAPMATFPEAIRSERDLAAAKLALAAYEGYVADLKAGLCAGFNEAVDWLVGSLTRKAEKIRQQIQAEHSTEAAKLQARIDTLRRQLDGQGDGLYRAIDQAEFQRRTDVLDQAVSFMQFLASMGGGDAVQARIGASLKALERMRAGLPEVSPEGRRLRLVQQVADLRRTLSDLVKDGHKLQGEELAERLRVLRLEVAATVQSSWAVEADLTRLRDRLSAEAVSLAAVEQERSRLLKWGLLKTAGTVLGSLGLAFVLLVTADVLNAFFDAAEAIASGGPAGRPLPPDAERPA
jgi:regulator of replication initiation timing